MQNSIEEDLDTLRSAGISNINLLASAAAQFIREHLNATTNDLNAFTNQEISFLNRSGAKGIGEGYKNTAVLEELKKSMFEFSYLVASSYTKEQVAVMLKVSINELKNRIKNKEIYVIETVEGDVFPSWQFFKNGTLLPDISSICQSLPDDAHPLEVFRFIRSPLPELSIGTETFSPAEWLFHGWPASEIIKLAKSL